ncbi:MAG: CaiF/GrlA family transcriptional regulator [Candidatus Symbiodolus clandestinus]
MKIKAVKSEIIHPKQSNYDTYFIPQEVGHIRNVPLYRLVSYWGLLKNSYICRDDIATAFGISLRQASGIISSIYRKHQDIICSIKRVKSGKGNIAKNYMLIHKIVEEEKKEKKRTANLLPCPRIAREKRSQDKGQVLWSRLLTRPTPQL